MARVAIDTNVFAYAADLRHVDADDPKREIAKALIARSLSAESIFLAAQVCVELHHLLVRKGGRSRDEASGIVRSYISMSVIVPTDDIVVDLAFDLSTTHKFQTYDAVILAAAARAGCDVLYSEDMQDGFEWQGVRIVDPFA